MADSQSTSVVFVETDDCSPSDSESSTASSTDTTSSSPSDPTLPAFSYPSNVKVIYCSDLTTFEAALPLLANVNVLGIDIEYEPCGRRNKKETLEKSKAAKQLDAESDAIADAEYGRLMITSSYSTPWIKKFKSGRVSGLVRGDHRHRRAGLNSDNLLPQGFFPAGTWANGGDDEYLRLARYTKTKISVLQIATADVIIVAHFARFTTASEFLDSADFAPAALKAIFADDSILKLGVGVSGVSSDAALLARYLDMRSNGLLELGDMHSLITPDADKTRPPGLKTLTERYLSYTLAGKGTGSLCTSEWQLPQPLTEAQLAYAANDAYVSLRIYEAMKEKAQTMAGAPTMPKLHSQGEFSFKQIQDQRISALRAKGTKSSKRTLSKLVGGQAPPAPLVVPEGGSKTAARSANRRKNMHPADAALAEILTTVRDEIFDGLEPVSKIGAEKQKFWVLHDNWIDKIAKYHPRPQTVDELHGVITNSNVRERFWAADQFLSAILAYSASEGVPALNINGQDTKNMHDSIVMDAGVMAEAES